MDIEFSRLVDAAADIAASGRWDAVNARVEHLLRSPGAGSNQWWIQLFASLCSQVFSEYLLLKRAHNDPRDRLAELAWRARNLLELSVWCQYCSKSTEKARRFYEDRGRDALALLEAFEKWGHATARDPDWTKLFTDSKQRLSRRAALLGIASLDSSYKRVSQAAGECGFGNHFNLSYRMLSKFAHPTSMQILAPPDPGMLALLGDSFFSQGCLFFTGAFVALEEQFLHART